MAERLPVFSKVYLTLSLPWLIIMLREDYDRVALTKARLTCQEPPRGLF
jgi:hypothetical protein